MKIENIAEAITTLDGVTGLLMFVSCLYDMPEASEPAFKYKSPAFALLSDLTQSAGDFLSDNEAAITQALEAEAKEKARREDVRSSRRTTPQHNG